MHARLPLCHFYAKLTHMEHLTLLDAQTVAARLGVSRRTLIRMASDGRVPALKAPGYKGAYLFQESAIEQLLAERAGKGKHA